MKLIKTLFIFSLLLLSCHSSEKEWDILFNGENLDGWHAYGTQNSHDGWAVQNGVLTFDFKSKKGIKSSNLITNQKYTNFELSLDWKISQQGNSGIFWGVVENDQYEHPYQTGPEIQILDDNWTAYIENRGDKTRAGSLFGLLPPSKIVSKPAESWNHYLLHIDHIKNIGYLEFNGKTVLRFPVHGPKWNAMVATSSFANWASFGKAKSGHIGLQEYGGKVAFRNIKIRELYSDTHK